MPSNALCYVWSYVLSLVRLHHVSSSQNCCFQVRYWCQNLNLAHGFRSLGVLCIWWFSLCPPFSLSLFPSPSLSSPLSLSLLFSFYYRCITEDWFYRDLFDFGQCWPMFSDFRYWPPWKMRHLGEPFDYWAPYFDRYFILSQSWRMCHASFDNNRSRQLKTHLFVESPCYRMHRVYEKARIISERTALHTDAAIDRIRLEIWQDLYMMARSVVALLSNPNPMARICDLHK